MVNGALLLLLGWSVVSHKLFKMCQFRFGPEGVNELLYLHIWQQEDFHCNFLTKFVGIIKKKKKISYLFTYFPRVSLIIPFHKLQLLKTPNKSFSCSSKSKLKSSHGTTNLGAKWRCKNVSRCDTTPDSDHGRTNGENHHSRFAFKKERRQRNTRCASSC